jgi:hypothetical protein
MPVYGASTRLAEMVEKASLDPVGHAPSRLILHPIQEIKHYRVYSVNIFFSLLGIYVVESRGPDH